MESNFSSVILEGKFQKLQECVEFLLEKYFVLIEKHYFCSTYFSNMNHHNFM